MSLMTLATRSSGVGSKYGLRTVTPGGGVSQISAGAPFPDDHPRGDGVADELVARRDDVDRHALLGCGRGEHARAALVQEPLGRDGVGAHEHRVGRGERMRRWRHR